MARGCISAKRGNRTGMDDKVATTTEAIEADALPKMHEAHTNPDSCAGLECPP